MKRFLKQKNFLFKLGIFICIAWILIALFSPYFVSQDPIAQDMTARFKPPSAGHLLGTDELGRDVFSRVLVGSRVSIAAGLVTVCITIVVGTIYGGIAGYIGGIVDDIMMRVAELINAFPPLILAMVIASALGPSIFNSVLAMTIIWWPNYARLMRSMVITLKENEYIVASRVLGASHLRILVKEIVPNALGSLLVMATLDIGNAIVTFSGLSFLGLGTQPPTPEWGSMVSDGVNNMNYWWMSTFPGLSIFSMSIGANFVGDGLRDYLDPKIKNK
ncbi:peptide ABC transporter permease [Enterococcus florum]|uniref:Peptide ABC transporter permease n=1 Tax=Enterococcus florum TaxID=2480627 RepID=A0A4P5PB16_9ENTE|nr:ABC transporter permease [Enterococcus florum]GCF95345.1 peptide ABC transporter permease [Enterococcus florum]